MSKIVDESELAEPVFGINTFRKPKILKPTEVVCQSVLMILFGRPGCYPTIPELGMDIRQYRGKDMNDLDTDEILTILKYQCGLLRENIVTNNIGIRKSTTADGRPCVIFSIPMSSAQAKGTVIIGISNTEDDTVYNYKLVDEMLML